MARLLAMALNQEPGISFVETLSPVLKPTTIRTLLSLAIARNWLIKEFDVQNPFLPFLQEEVYMKQPSGFVDSPFPTHF